jgi:5'-methylthioadenosine phosphorylase
MVIANLQKNASQAKEIITRVLPQIPTEPDCSCHHALQNAILTDKKLWPPKIRAALRPILKNYL